MIKNDIETNPVGFGPNSPLLSDTEQNTGISPMTLTTPCIIAAYIQLPVFNVTNENVIPMTIHNNIVNAIFDHGAPGLSLL